MAISLSSSSLPSTYDTIPSVSLLTEFAVSVHVRRCLDPAGNAVRVPLAALSVAVHVVRRRRARRVDGRGRPSATHLSGTATAAGRIRRLALNTRRTVS